MSKSKYAEYFDIRPEENSATCLTCGAVLNMPNRSTSALKYHIENKHNIQCCNRIFIAGNQKKFRLSRIQKLGLKSTLKCLSKIFFSFEIHFRSIQM